MANKHRFELRFCLHEKVISRRLEITSGGEKWHIPAVSSATSITYKLFFIKRMFVLKE